MFFLEKQGFVMLRFR